MPEQMVDLRKIDGLYTALLGFDAKSLEEYEKSVKWMKEQQAIWQTDACQEKVRDILSTIKAKKDEKFENDLEQMPPAGKKMIPDVLEQMEKQRAEQIEKQQTIMLK